MTVTPADAARLLGVAAAFDRRTVGKADSAAWADALHDLDPQECVAAIRSHYAATDAFLMPAHVRQRVKAFRDTEHERAQSRALRSQLAIEAAEHDREASRRGYELARMTLAKARGWDDTKQADLDAQRAAQGVRCPFCKAAPGSLCRNVDRPAGKPHPSRVEAALQGAK